MLTARAAGIGEYLQGGGPANALTYGNRNCLFVCRRIRVEKPGCLDNGSHKNMNPPPTRRIGYILIGCFCAIVAALLGVVGRVMAKNTSTKNQDWAGEPFSSQFEKFETVTVVPHPSDKSIVAANCERAKQWWGEIRLFKHLGDKIEWTAVFPKDYLESRGTYVVSCRWVPLAMLKQPALELIESTHMGNGSLWLFELNGKELRSLLHTPVRGYYWQPEAVFGVPREGEARYVGAHLNVEYGKEEGAEFESVVLTGEVSIQDLTGKELPTKSYEQRCIWDSDKRVFTARPPSSPKRPER